MTLAKGEEERVNDNVIDFYLGLITNRSENMKCLLPHVRNLYTSFAARLWLQGEAARWFSKWNIFEYDMIFIPVPLN